MCVCVCDPELRATAQQGQRVSEGPQSTPNTPQAPFGEPGVPIYPCLREGCTGQYSVRKKPVRYKTGNWPQFSCARCHDRVAATRVKCSTCAAPATQCACWENLPSPDAQALGRGSRKRPPPQPEEGSGKRAASLDPQEQKMRHYIQSSAVAIQGQQTRIAELATVAQHSPLDLTLQIAPRPSAAALCTAPQVGAGAQDNDEQINDIATISTINVTSLRIKAHRVQACQM